MSQPALLLVDADSRLLDSVTATLRDEFGGELRVQTARGSREAIEAVEALHRDAGTLALLVAEQGIAEEGGCGLPVRAAELFPRAKRVLYSAEATADEPLHASDRVAIDAYLLKPWDSPEVSLFPALRALLEEWQKDPAPAIETVRVVGFQWSPQAHDVKDFLARARIPYVWMDVERDADARRLLDELGIGPEGTPLVLFPDGSHLENPSDTELAEKVGLSTEPASPFYDLIIVGGGPAGLAAAVYGASEGLRTLIVEQEAPGGQAGTSARIENYLGFPDGLSGGELAQRAVTQARRFGVEILASREVTEIRAEDPYRIVVLDDEDELVCHTVLLATGVAWRTLDAPGCPALVGAGIYYGAATAEAMSLRGEDVFLLGGGNSAGQAAMLLARYARTVTMLALEGSLEEKMSRYLLDRIQATPNITVRPRTTVVEARGNGRLEEITIQDVESGETETAPAKAMFVFIGAKPETEWLAGLLERDEQGFVLCGAGLPREDGHPAYWPLERDPYLLETSVPGIFVAGDVRAESVKRVASAVGEGSMAVQFIHQYLSTR